jgi:hypothetical protein
VGGAAPAAVRAAAERPTSASFSRLRLVRIVNKLFAPALLCLVTIVGRAGAISENWFHAAQVHDA